MKKELKNYEDNSLPLLEKINDTNCFKNSYIEIYKDIYTDTSEFFDKYENGILDMFPNQLSIEDKQIELLSNEYFLASNENNYLQFMERLFNDNGQLCVLNIDLNLIKYFYFLDKINGLDKIYQCLFLHNYINFKNQIGGLYYIKDINLFKTIVVLLLRETVHIHYIYFPKNHILIDAGDEGSLPIFSIDKKTLEKYEKVSHECGLYIRNNTLK